MDVLWRSIAVNLLAKEHKQAHTEEDKSIQRGPCSLVFEAVGARHSVRGSQRCQAVVSSRCRKMLRGSQGEALGAARGRRINQELIARARQQSKDWRCYPRAAVCVSLEHVEQQQEYAQDVEMMVVPESGCR